MDKLKVTIADLTCNWLVIICVPITSLPVIVFGLCYCCLLVVILFLGNCYYSIKRHSSDTILETTRLHQHDETKQETESLQLEETNPKSPQSENTHLLQEHDESQQWYLLGGVVMKYFRLRVRWTGMANRPENSNRPNCAYSVLTLLL